MLEEKTKKVIKRSEKLFKKALVTSGTDVMEQISLLGKKERKAMLESIKLYEDGKELILETTKVMDDLDERLKWIESQNEEILGILKEIRKED